jgi:AcrR family transcriptional regulator
VRIAASYGESSYETTRLTLPVFNVIYSDMKTHTVRKYESPLRESQTQDTRTRILEALGRLLARSEGEDFSFDALAAEAGVERRTLFRHFANKEKLFDAFWVWINARLAKTVMPSRPEDFVKLPLDVFDGFDQNDGIIRASIHLPSGRAMRQRTLAERRNVFADALKDVNEKLPPEEARKLLAVAHLLYSAPAWETLKDYAGLSGREAGEAVGWAMATLIEALSRDRR